MAWRFRKKPVKRPTAASAKLRHARGAARMTMKQLGDEVGVSWRTIARWESGETRPDVQEWLKLVSVLRRLAPTLAAELAESAGIMVPLESVQMAGHPAQGTRAAEATPADVAPPHPVLDERAIELAVLRTADHLDVAPKRVRAALRDLLATAMVAHASLPDLLRVIGDGARFGDSG